MIKLNVFCIFASLGFALGGVARADSVGNGGDQLRAIFNDARKEAASQVRSLTKCSFAESTPAELKYWILSHQEALAQDIESSPHRWITDEQATCAWTQPNPQSEISLSFTACGRVTREVKDAARLLVHESVHHQSVTDETFPDIVASTIFEAIPHRACTEPVADQCLKGTEWYGVTQYVANPLLPKAFTRWGAEYEGYFEASAQISIEPFNSSKFNLVVQPYADNWYGIERAGKELTWDYDCRIPLVITHSLENSGDLTQNYSMTLKFERNLDGKLSVQVTKLSYQMTNAPQHGGPYSLEWTGKADAVFTQAR